MVCSFHHLSYFHLNQEGWSQSRLCHLFTQKDLIEAIEKAERRIKREKKQKEKLNKLQNNE